LIVLALLIILLMIPASVSVYSSRGERLASRHAAAPTQPDAATAQTGDHALRGLSPSLTLSGATQAGATLQFSSTSYSAREADGAATITVTRAGDTSGAATVDYATSDLTATERSDYTAALGTLRFAAGETQKTFSVLLTDVLSQQGDRILDLKLSNPTGGPALGSPAEAMLTILDDAANSATNPVDLTAFYVRQHYHDFLNREPDASGLQFWTNDIEQCGTDQQCRDVHRINTSAAFFLSIEFQNTGYLVYRLHQAAFGTGETLRLRSFLPDTQEIGQGVVVGQGDWQGQIEANKQAFVAEFVARPEFVAAYPSTLTPAQFVDALNSNTADPRNPTSGGALTQTERDQLVAQLTANNTAQGRAEVLRAVAENAEFQRRQFNKAFVYMQYVGYLRRNPNDAPDSDFSGYDFWLSKLNLFNGDFVQAEMVKAFISSTEYRGRFVHTQALNQPPFVNAGPAQTLALPNAATLNGTVTDDGLPAGNSLVISWTKLSGPGPVIFGSAASAFTSALFSSPGTYTLRLTASDGQFTRTSDVTVTVNPDSNALPPDPATVAPPLDETVTTTVGSATQFLYTGPNPIQQGVAPGTIKPQRAAVLRGRVLDENNQPLPNVRVTILNHSEFGQTRSRADGMFDIAVNGGGLLTLNYAKAGFMPVQRQMDVPWQDYLMAHDVVMLPFDDNVTAIDLSASTPVQVAQGTTMTDASGSRRAVLMFKQGTTATLRLPDGTTESLPLLHVRATEYTVGPSGPAAMPGDLPSASQYTYASEYSIDEAVSVSATSVMFNQPVAQYNENFLNFPAGTVIPSGSYDKASGIWIPSDNGLVIKILSITGGSANLDIDGSGNPASDASLNALGVNAAERQQLATLYQPGQTLWRVPLTHFSGWDSNWGFGPPAGAAPAGGSNGGGPPSAGGPGPPGCLTCPCTELGCILGLTGQTLSEEAALTGTPFFLRYDSDRTQGYRAADTLNIPLSGATLPGPLKRIELNVTVAGRMFTQIYPGQPNQIATFTWDGLDAYMRVAQGQQVALIDIGNVYDAAYQNTANFGYNGNGVPITGDRARKEITLHQIQRAPIGTFDYHPQALGGWSLSVHHVYDPIGRVLYQGDGTRRNVQSVNAVIDTVAGNGQPPSSSCSNNNVDAKAACLDAPFGIVTAPDGTYYFTDTNQHRIFRVTTDGILSVIAGTGDCGISGDGGPAANAPICKPEGIALARDGSIYFADFGSSRIRRISADGIINTVAGNGTNGSGGDGGPATQAQLNSPLDVTIGPDGTLYIADANNHRIRRVDPSGIMSTLAGTGTFIGDCGFSGDGGQATQAQLCFPEGVAVGLNGELFIADTGNRLVRRVAVDGKITTIAGTPGQQVCANSTDACGDGGPAAQAQFGAPVSLNVAADGSLYVNDPGIKRIRRIAPDGQITTIVGSGNGCSSAADPCGDTGPAPRADLGFGAQGPQRISLLPDGSFYIAETSNHRVRRVAPPLPGFNAQAITVPSEDGDELYFFDSNGRHQRTVNTLTGANLYTFAYDGAGRLTSVTDGDGNVTTIQRDATGNPTALVAPFGQSTTFSLDANGYLSRISDPAGQVSQFAYTMQGLMTSKQDPRGNQNTFTYDALGRLARDDDAATGFQTLSRADQGLNYTVTHNTALGRVTLFAVQSSANGDLKRIATRPDGTQSQSIERANGTQTFVEPTGTTTNVTQGPDPRWKMQSPLDTSVNITTPGSLSFNATFARVVMLSNPNDPLSLTTQTDTFNVNGQSYTRVFTAANKTFAFTTPTGRQGASTIDAQGRTTQEQFGGLNAAAYAYDTRGRLSNATLGAGAEARAYNLSYNSAGFLASFTDPLGLTESYAYDPAGRVTQQTLRDGRVIGYSYDANGNLTSITPPGRPAHTFTFNALNLGASYTAPNVGGSSQTTYAYNLDRQLTTITRPDSQTISLVYDGAGRLSTLGVPGGQYGFAYSATTGNLAGITAPGGGTLAFAYDGSLHTGTTWAGTVAGSVSRTFDNFFRLNSQSVNGANTVNFTYDNDSLLTGAGNLSLAHNAQNGLLTGTTLGNVTDSVSYNGFAEATSYTAAFNSTQLLQEQYTYDKLGRVSQKTESIAGQTNTYAYTYDQAGRLTNVTFNGGPNPTVTYAYDSNSNRLTYNLGGVITNGTYDNQDRLTQYGNTTYIYTANGELQSQTLSGQTTQYSYDVLGNLTHVTLPDATQIDYVIDGQDRRIGKKVNGTLVQGFLYQNKLAPVAELDGANNLVSRFVYGSRRNVPDYMIKGGATYRLIADHLGSVRLVVDVNTGAVAQRMDYNEFGVVLIDTNPGFQPFGFAGGLYDRDTGLVRFGARDYDAQTGRWTAKDPILFDGGDTNLYGYVLNDPVNFTDQTGEKGVSVGANYSYSDYGNTITTIPGGGAIVQTFDGRKIRVPPKTKMTIPGIGGNTIINTGAKTDPTGGGSSTSDGSQTSTDGFVIPKEYPKEPAPKPEPEPERKVSCKIRSGGGKSNGKSFPDLTGIK
jgi:RHS repeat-associated protein